MTEFDIAPETAERNISIIPEIGLTEIDGEPRARDIEIAERLGYSRPRAIRDLIKANIAEIEGFGTAPRRTALFAAGNGAQQEAKEYWLNEEQALLVAALAKTENAAAVRAMLIRCFVAWRRGHLAPVAESPSVPAATLEQIERSFGIVRSTIHKVTEMEKVVNTLPALIAEVRALSVLVQPAMPGVVIRHGKTAGAILKAAGITHCPRNLARWFGDRLEAAGCRVEGRVDIGTARARLFDPDKAEQWLDNGGRAAVEMRIAERRGQGALALTGPARVPARHGEEAFPIIPPDIFGEGIGAILMKGEPVFFDIKVGGIVEGERYVVITSAGDVMVDTPLRHSNPTWQPMGPRSAMTSPQMEAVPGRHDPRSVQHGCVILGRVVERQNVVHLPIAAH